MGLGCWNAPRPKVPTPQDGSAAYQGSSGCNVPTSLRRVRVVRARARRWILRHESRPYGVQQARKLYNAGNSDKGTSSAEIQFRLSLCQKTRYSKGRARPVPAAAVTQAARVVTAIIGSKGSVAGLVSLLGNPAAQLSGFQGILLDSRPGEVRGTSGVGVKSCNP